jgi:hypothetical protein
MTGLAHAHREAAITGAKRGARRAASLISASVISPCSASPGGPGGTVGCSATQAVLAGMPGIPEARLGLG